MISAVDVITIIVFLGMCILINCIWSRHYSRMNRMWYRQCRRVNNNWADFLHCTNERIFALEKQIAELGRDKQEKGK